MRKLLYIAAGLIAIGSVAWAQSVGWPPPGGMLAALGVYNSTPPILTNTQVSPIQLSAAGRVLVDAAVTGGGDATAANQVLQITQETAFNTALGLMADAACATDNGTCTLIALSKRGNQRLTTINTTLGTPMQATGGTVGLVAGSAIIGNVRVDQTTPGTTNGAAIVGVNAATALAGNGATGTGSLRVTIANDNTLPTGWASSTAANQTATQAPVAPATATATKSDLIGCQATSAGINPTTGQQAAIDCDLNNNILTSPGGSPNLATAQVSVTTGNISVAAARALRRSVKITNVTGTSAIYCGNTGVATTTGDYLGATTGSWVSYNTTAAVFCTVAATTQTVTVAEVY